MFFCQKLDYIIVHEMKYKTFFYLTKLFLEKNDNLAKIVYCSKLSTLLKYKSYKLKFHQDLLVTDN